MFVPRAVLFSYQGKLRVARVEAALDGALGEGLQFTLRETVEELDLC